MPNNPVPVLRSVFAAYAFFLVHWRKILIAGAPYTAAYAVQLSMMQLRAPDGGGAAMGMVLLLLSVTTLATSVALSAAALRLAVRGEMPGFFGLQFGRDELRVFAATILITLLTLIVFVLVFLFWGTLFGSVAMGGLDRAGIDPAAAELDLADATAYMGAADWVAVIAAGLVGVAIVAWLSARLVLALPATIAEGKIQVMKAWPLSHGQGLRIAAALILAGLPVTLVELGLYEAIALAIGHRPIDVTAIIAADLADTPGIARMREYSLWLGLFSAINIPVFSGLYAYIYQKRTRPAAQ